MTKPSYVALAAWLENNHAPIFKNLLREAKLAKAREIVKTGFRKSSLGDVTDYISSVSSYASSPVDYISAPTDSFTGTADTFQSVQNSISADTATAAVGLNDVSAQTDFSSSLNDPNNYLSSSGGAPISVPASSTVSDSVNTVGNYLSSPAGMQSLAQTANSLAGAGTAAAIISSQGARAAAGQAPAAISYGVGLNGAGLPTTVAYLGSRPLTAPALAALTPTASFLQSPFIWIMLAAAVALFILE